MAERSHLAEIARALDTALSERKVPVRAYYAPDLRTKKTTTYAKDRVELEEAGSNADSFSPPRAPGGNPPARFNRSVGALCRIYAQSTVSGATASTHRGRCDEILDHVGICLDNVLRGGRSQWTLQGGGFEELEDLAGSDTRSGALYVFRFAFDRAMRDVTWASGDAAPEVTLGGEGGVTIANTTSVHLENGPDDAPAETGCGG